MLARTESLSAEQGGRGLTSCFAAPDGAAFVRLSLLYQRQPGTVRVEGKLLKEVRLSNAGQTLPGGENLHFQG